MKIQFEQTYKKSYGEILSMLSYSWGREKLLYIGWLFWHFIIEF